MNAVYGDELLGINQQAATAAAAVLSKAVLAATRTEVAGQRTLDGEYAGQRTNLCQMNLCQLSWDGACAHE
jgi:hypothetical protein